MRHIPPILLLTLFAVQLGYSDYLEVRRKATVKEEPRSDAAIIEHVEEGTFLELLNNGAQDTGYYKVKASSTSQDGWIYRSLVRRHEGEIPGTTLVLGDKVFSIPLEDLDRWSDHILTTFEDATITGLSSVHNLESDCEMHFGARIPEYQGDPEGVVLEPMNICLEKFFGKAVYKKSDWAGFGASLVNQSVTVEGVPRIWPEHLHGAESASNPNHALELHPLTKIVHNNNEFDFSSFVYVPEDYEGGLQRESAERIVEKTVVHVKKKGDDAEIFFDSGQIGNFSILDVRFDKDDIRTISGGHRIKGQVVLASLEARGVSMVTVMGSPIDSLVARLKSGDEELIRFEALVLFSLDPDALHDAVSASNGNPVKVNLPIQLIVYGTVQ